MQEIFGKVNLSR